VEQIGPHSLAHNSCLMAAEQHRALENRLAAEHSIRSQIVDQRVPSFREEKLQL
jgi:hypothetical protein